MKAIFAIIMLIFGVTVLPLISARHSWAQFKASTYAVDGQRLLADQQWRKAASAFAAANERNPKNTSYMLFQKLALTFANPIHKQKLLKIGTRMAAHINPSAKPILEVTTQRRSQSQNQSHNQHKPTYYLMAIIPASGSPDALVADKQGYYWGPTVRLLPAQNKQPTIIADALPKPSSAELAYAALSDENFNQARLLFAQAIAEEPRPQWIADNRPLTKWLAVQTGVTYRNGTPALATTQALLGQGGSWLDVSARLNGNPNRPLALTGFLYSAQSLQSPRLDPKSLQAGFGLRWQPVKNITVEVARLVKVGSQSRDDWLLRAGAGVGAWRPANVGQARWLHWQVRADAALIGLSRADIFAQADARFGLGIRVNDQVSLTPYIGSTATLQKDVATATLVEVSPGIWLHRSGRIPLDARLEYRRKIAGSAAASNGVALTFSVGF
jgi:Bacteriophage N adsorption protein A C-term